MSDTPSSTPPEAKVIAASNAGRAILMAHLTELSVIWGAVLLCALDKIDKTDLVWALSAIVGPALAKARGKPVIPTSAALVGVGAGLAHALAPKAVTVAKAGGVAEILRRSVMLLALVLAGCAGAPVRDDASTHRAELERIHAQAREVRARAAPICTGGESYAEIAAACHTIDAGWPYYETAYQGARAAVEVYEAGRMCAEELTIAIRRVAGLVANAESHLQAAQQAIERPEREPPVENEGGADP